MKKALTLILTICILMLALGLVACEKPCEHTYDNACDTKCNECEEEREITHSFKDATCTEPKTCTVCSLTEGEPNGHTPSADDGDCTTPVSCSICQATVVEARAEHEALEDDGNCMTAIYCKHCEQIAIEATQEHKSSEEYIANESHHWYNCVTTGCKAELVKSEHTWTYEKVNNEVHKRLSCNECSYEANVLEEHTPDSDGNCICGESYEAKVGNKYYELFSDALVAWEDGTTLTLVTNISYEEGQIKIDGKSVALDLNGYKLAMENPINIGKDEKGALSISDSREGGSISANGTFLIRVYNGNFELNSGRLNQTIDLLNADAVCDIKGGEICGENGALLTQAINTSGVVNISGGRLTARFPIWALNDSEINISGTPTIIGKDANENNAGSAIFLINAKITISGSPILQGDSNGEIVISGDRNQIILETQPEENSKWRVGFDGSTLKQAKVLTPAQGVELDITRFESKKNGYLLEKQNDGCIYFVACTHENGQITINEGNTHNISCEKCNINIENKAHTNQDGKCVCGYEYVTITGEDKAYEYVDGGVKLDVAELFEISSENCEVKYSLIIPTDSDGEGTLEGTSATLELVGTYIVVAEIEETKNNTSATKQITIEVTSPAGSGSFDGEWVGF